MPQPVRPAPSPAFSPTSRPRLPDAGWSPNLSPADAQAFLDGFVAAMLANSYVEDEEDSVPLSARCTPGALTQDAWSHVNTVCARFTTQAQDLLQPLLERPGYGWHQAGANFWGESNRYGEPFHDLPGLDDDLHDELIDRCMGKPLVVRFSGQAVTVDPVTHDYRSENQRRIDEVDALRHTLNDVADRADIPHAPRSRL